MMKYFKIFSALILAATLAGCATTTGRMPEQAYTVNYQLGKIYSMNVIGVPQSAGTSGGGAIVGGLAGGVIGNQFGKGNGRKAMTVVGALAGGLIGNGVEASSNTVNVPHYELFIALHNGQQLRIIEPTQGNNFYPGQYVKVFQHPKSGFWRAIPD